MTRNKVYLFHCSRYNLITPIITMGLWGLADYITKEGYTVKIVHTLMEEQLNGVFDPAKFLSEDVLAVGFSAHWFPMLKESLDVAKMIKEQYPSICTIMGGYTASYFAGQVINDYPYIDAVIQGDGEKPLISLLNALSSNATDWESIPNLVWRKNGKVTFNDFSYVSNCDDIRHLNYASQPDYLYHYEDARSSSLLNMQFAYTGDFEITDFPPTNTFFLLTGKGCPVNCTFCGGGREAQKVINNRSRCMFLEDDQIIETIKKAIQQGHKSFYVSFDPLPERPRYVSWLRRIKEEKLDIDLFFGFWRLPNSEIIKEFKGVTSNLIFEISPETIEENLREKVRGFPFSNEEFYHTLDELFANRIYGHIYFSYPLPFETEQDVLLTRKAFWDIIRKYPHYIEPFYLRLSTDPGSPLHRNPEAFGCGLLVNSLEEHMEKSVGNSYGNITIHKVTSIPEGRQRDLYRRIECDNSLKRFFKSYLRLFVQAFSSCDALIAFIDGFYQFISFDQSILRDGKQLIYHLNQYALQNRPNCDSYLYDLLAFLSVNANLDDTSLQEESINTVVPAGIQDRIVHLQRNYALLCLNHDIYSTYKTMQEKKTFIRPETSKDPILYLLSRIKGEYTVYQINQSMYDLLLAFSTNDGKSVRTITEEIALQYADSTQELNAIADDLTKTAAALIEQKVLCLEDLEL